jgi:hypothetical protein
LKISCRLVGATLSGYERASGYEQGNLTLLSLLLMPVHWGQTFLTSSTLSALPDEQGAAERLGVFCGGKVQCRYELHSAEPAVSDKPKRRWYQLSLKTLLAGTLALGLLLGVLGRVQFLRSQAKVHEQEYFRYIDSALEIHRNEPRNSENEDRTRQLIEISQWHRAIAESYHRAAYRPWQVVDEKQFVVLPESAT